MASLALRGKRILQVARDLFGDWVLDMKYHWLAHTELDGVSLVISCTGWSGELGFHIYLEDHHEGDQLWERIMAVGESWQGSNEHLWKISRNNKKVGQVTRCVYSRRLKKMLAGRTSR